MPLAWSKNVMPEKKVAEKKRMLTEEEKLTQMIEMQSIDFDRSMDRVMELRSKYEKELVIAKSINASIVKNMGKLEQLSARGEEKRKNSSDELEIKCKELEVKVEEIKVRKDKKTVEGSNNVKFPQIVYRKQDLVQGGKQILIEPEEVKLPNIRIKSR